MKMRRAVVAVAGMVWMAGAAMAHSKPKTMVPAANSTVSTPKEVSVVFTEALEPKFSSLEVMDASGKVVSTVKSVADAKDPMHLTLPLPKLAPGVYTVAWKSAATDGHKETGKYTFTVK